VLFATLATNCSEQPFSSVVPLFLLSYTTGAIKNVLLCIDGRLSINVDQLERGLRYWYNKCAFFYETQDITRVVWTKCWSSLFSLLLPFSYSPTIANQEKLKMYALCRHSLVNKVCAWNFFSFSCTSHCYLQTLTSTVKSAYKEPAYKEIPDIMNLYSFPMF